METEISSSVFQRSILLNSTSKDRSPDGPVDEECDPECRSNNVTQTSGTQHSPRSCNRSRCTNPSCGIVEPSPNADPNTENPSQNPNADRNTISQNDDNTSHVPRDFRDIRRAIGIGRESTPRPEGDLETSNIEKETPRQNCGRSDCDDPNCNIPTSTKPKTEHPSHDVSHSSHIDDRNTEYPAQNDDNTSHLSRIFRDIRRSIRRSIGIGPESTPRPEGDLHSSNIQQETPRQNCGRNDCDDPNCRIPSSITKSQTEHPYHDVGHSSHIPRSSAPKPSQFNIPSFMDRSQDRTTGTEPPEVQDELLFGLVRLKQNDVCYTSGTLEWVGRKRTFPVNSGFKILNENELPGNEPMLKKFKGLDRNIDDFRECDCVEMLPTVNAIVDHLNALHQAVDLIDLRLNTVEDTVYKK